MTRSQQQERTRAAVLAASEREFGEHGYAEAKVDRIAERAELTRGAVYSNFPSKRALYLAVLLEMVEQPGGGAGRSPVPVSPSPSPSAAGPAGALGAFARAWLERLPLAGDPPAGGRLQLHSLAGVVDDEPARTALAQVTRLEALLLALALEALGPRRRGPMRPEHVRRVRLAELVLTLLHGAGQLAETAPGFGDPFDVALACEQLAGIDLADTWDPPHLPFVAPAQACRDRWVPPPELPDQVSGGQAGFGGGGVIAVVGSSRLEAAEEAVRAARPGDQVTVSVVTSDPAEIGRLVRLRISDLTGLLRRVFAPEAWPRLQVVLDDRAVLASAAGVPEAGDATEAAVRIEAGTVVARAYGRGATHAAATAAGSSRATRGTGP